MESSIYASEDQKNVIYSDIVIVNIELLLIKVLPHIGYLHISNNDTKKLFLNYFIIEVCEYLKTIKQSKYAFFINSNLPVINKEESDIYLKLIEEVLQILSITYIKKSKSLSLFYKNLLEMVDEELISLEIIKTISKKKNSSKSLLNFLKRNGLTFLHDTYFKNPSNKLVLFR